jgi:TonB family protein
MNRLQKKCFLASAGMHLSLLVIFLFGSAFVSKSSKSDVSDLNFEPTILTDTGLQGGGNPKAGSPPMKEKSPTPAPPPPAPPQPKSEPKPEPKSKPVEEPTPKLKDKAEADSLETASKKLKRPQISTNLVTKKITNDKQALAKSAAAKAAVAEQRRENDARLALAREIQQTAASLSGSGSSATKLVVGDYGPGGGGPSYGGYESWVKKVYMDAWAPPSDPSKDSAVAEATITIRRDGTIDDFRIVSRSGDSSVDASVQKTLERVRTIGRPFPEGAKDSKRTYTLVFDLKAKRGMA